MDKLYLDTYAHNWGFLLPCESGVVWEQQTGGVMCTHDRIEGIFIPLNYPRDLLNDLKRANYDGDGIAAFRIWKQIKECMHFDFEKLDNRMNTEGLQWIKLTEFESGWGHGEWVRQLIGEEMILIYPNCD